MPPSNATTTNAYGPKDSTGWDGKLRVEKRAVLATPYPLSDPEYSDQDVPPVEQIDADEGMFDDIDLVHCRISSVPKLQLERFTKLERLCLRQNQITHIELAESIGTTLQELDLYDNLISHIRGFDTLVWLRSLDLSFNKIKHIKNISHLKELTDLYFVQNKIQKIEGLEGLSKIRNLELAANRIREIENLETLKGLEELWLGKNKITELKNLSTLSNLKILSLQSNRITQISGLSSLPSLTEIYISHNSLSSISGLENLRFLRVLDISNNMIANLTNVKHLNSLEELWASNNQLSSFIEVVEELADKQELTTVYFEGNPLQVQNPVLYRNKIRLALPQVKQIDATFVQVS
ncbi:Protein phosphatase 1 regulatory subunit sds22 [Xylographa soralifera]|nr:Protein phosphatase 1 regulatory subunit sds22 [Xylographa soralifera]